VGVTAGDTWIDVTWTAPSDDGGAPLTGYVAAVEPGGASCTTEESSCRITGLVNGTPYTVTVTATNAAGWTGTSAPTAAATPLGAPAAPTHVQAVAGNGTASVTWQAGVEVGAAPATDYVVTSVPASAGCTTTTTSCEIPGLTNGTAYTFVVTARDASGRSSSPSAASAGVVPVGPPSPPTDVLTEVGDGRVTVSWTVPSSDGGAAIRDYTAVATVAGQAATESSGPSCTTATTDCTISGLQNGVAYVVTVRARNAVDLVSAGASGEMVVPVGPPTAPAGLMVVGGNKQVTVSFLPSDGNGAPVTEYVATAAPGGAQCVARDGTTCTITGLSTGKNYTVSVIARNAAGLESAASKVMVKVVPGKPGR
jgi:hypothetical protein